MPGIYYEWKVNLAVSGEELTAYFDIRDGESTPCHYCRKPGYERNIVFKSIENAAGVISPRTKLFKEAKATLEKELLHGRGLCQQLDDRCLKAYQAEQHAASPGLSW